MLARHDHRPPPIPRNAADWHWSIRRLDGSWLARPEPEPGSPPGNMDPWTRRLADTWAFDDESSARRAAVAHGCERDGFTVHCIPRRGGEWLKGEGAYGDKPVSAPRAVTA